MRQQGVRLRALTGHHEGTILHNSQRLNGSLDRRSHRAKLSYWLSTSKGGLFNDLFQVILSIFSVAMYVEQTYHDSAEESSLSVVVLENLMAVLFTVDYLVRLYAAERRFYYIFSFHALVDIAAIAPVYIEAILRAAGHAGHVSDLSFIRILRVMRVLRILRMWRVVQLAVGGTQRQVFTLAFTITGLLFTAAGFVQAFEHRAFVDGDERVPYDLSFHTAIYFVVVTATTVGYGDVVCHTEEGRAVIVVMIVISVVLIPMQTSKLISLINLTSRYAGAYHATSVSKHVVVCGHFSYFSLRDFLSEFFNTDHGFPDANVVLLDPTEPTDSVVALLNQGMYTSHVSYVKGSPMVAEDLQKAAVDHAWACFILTRKSAGETDRQDNVTILTALAIQEFNAAIPLHIQLLKNKNVEHIALGDGGLKSIVCIEEMKMEVLAQSCLCDGLIPFIFNLVRSNQTPDGEEEIDPWLREYRMGAAMEIYRFRIPRIFKSRYFGQMVKFVHTHFRSTVFALEAQVALVGTTVLLHPGNAFKLEKGHSHAFVLAPNATVAANIEDIAGDLVLDDERDTAQLMRQMSTASFHSVSETETHTARPSSEPVPSRRHRSLKRRSTLLTHDKRTMWLKRQQSFQWLPEQAKTKEVVKMWMVGSPSANIPLRNLRNHIVVCGVLSNIQGFLRPLRAPHLKHQPPVILLDPQYPNEKVVEDIRPFNDVCLVKGSGLSSEDLTSVGYEHASTIVILTAAAAPRNGRDVVDIAQSDADPMLMALNIHAHIHCSQQGKPKMHPRTVTELVFRPNINILNSKLLGHHRGVDKVQIPNSELSTPYFAAGRAFTNSIFFNTLTCQNFFNSEILGIFKLFLSGCPSPDQDLFNALGVSQKYLMQLAIPSAFSGKAYGELLAHYIEDQDVLVLGLFRNGDQTDGPMGYVFTSPPSDTVLNTGDKVFALCASGQEQRQFGSPGQTRESSPVVTRNVSRDGSEDETTPPGTPQVRVSRLSDIQETLDAAKAAIEDNPDLFASEEQQGIAADGSQLLQVPAEYDEDDLDSDLSTLSNGSPIVGVQESSVEMVRVGGSPLNPANP